MLIFVNNDDKEEDVGGALIDEALLAYLYFVGLGVLVDLYENFPIFDSGLPPTRGEVRSDDSWDS